MSLLHSIESSNDRTRLWSTKAKNLSPYVPGEQPQHDNLCKLNTNENPFPPSTMVTKAIEQALSNKAAALRLYPSPESDELRQQLAHTYNVQPNQVFVGNGSDEVLALVFACFFMKELPLLAPDISYSFYPVYSDTFDIELIKIPLSADFSVNVDDYNQPCGGIIIANPNAPTGILLSLDDVEKLCQTHPDAVIVIDEAYIDFAVTKVGYGWRGASAITLIDKYDNLVVTQTFSKSRSLAGLRVGMAFANQSLINALTRMKNSFNSYPLDRLAQAGAKASLEDDEYFEEICGKVIDLRNTLTTELDALGFKSLNSHANFIFTKPPSTMCEGNSEKLATVLREQGIIVRYFNKPRISDYLRITIGTKAQNERLVTALQSLLAKKNIATQTTESSLNEKEVEDVRNALRTEELIAATSQIDTAETAITEAHLAELTEQSKLVEEGLEKSSIRYFVKCHDTKEQKTQTYRFSNEQDLIQFAQLATSRGYSILDTHITFYDVELVFFTMDAEANNSVIDAMDISRAENGTWWVNHWTQKQL